MVKILIIVMAAAIMIMQVKAATIDCFDERMPLLFGNSARGQTRVTAISNVYEYTSFYAFMYIGGDTMDHELVESATPLTQPRAWVANYKWWNTLAISTTTSKDNDLKYFRYFQGNTEMSTVMAIHYMSLGG